MEINTEQTTQTTEDAKTGDREEGFLGLGLSDPVLKAIADKGYRRPTPIQVQAMPPALQGRDVIGCAQTGTGKTAAFVIPMLERFAATPERAGPVRGLVLVPTRELADQVERAVGAYGLHLSVEPLVVYGGVPIRPQIRDLEWGCDVLVATPGRLLDHLQRGTVDLSRVEVLVLDEADRMLDMGFIEDVRSIVGETPRERQTLFFSATMPPAVMGLAHEMMDDPVFVQIGMQTKAEGITEVIHPVDYPSKHALMLHLLETWEEGGPAIVFTRMKSTAAYLSRFLQSRGVSVDDLHGDKSQPERTESLRSFREGRIRVLVATNVAARGLDIAGITHVVNFDVPDDPKDYVHRVGRTARGEETGDAVTLMSAHEILLVRQIEALTGSEIPRVTVPGFEPTFFTGALSKEEKEGPSEEPRSLLRRGRRVR